MTPGLETIFHNLSVATDYWLVTDAFAAIEGFLDPIEGYALLQLASFGPGVGAIVEIGSYAGKSTAYLAQGAKRARREKVVAIDHFQGSPEHQPGGAFATDLVGRGDLYAAFGRNLEQAGVRDWVHPLRASSLEAVAGWTHPIRLLFIDGDHAYEPSRRDFESWSPHVVPDGLVAFHDIEIFPGVTAYYQELTAEGAWREILSIGSLRVVTRAA